MTLSHTAESASGSPHGFRRAHILCVKKGSSPTVPTKMQRTLPAGTTNCRASVPAQCVVIDTFCFLGVHAQNAVPPAWRTAAIMDIASKDDCGCGSTGYSPGVRPRPLRQTSAPMAKVIDFKSARSGASCTQRGFCHAVGNWHGSVSRRAYVCTAKSIAEHPPVPESSQHAATDKSVKSSGLSNLLAVATHTCCVVSFPPNAAHSAVHSARDRPSSGASPCRLCWKRGCERALLGKSSRPRPRAKCSSPSRRPMCSFSSTSPRISRSWKLSLANVCSSVTASSICSACSRSNMTSSETLASSCVPLASSPLIWRWWRSSVSISASCTRP